MKIAAVSRVLDEEDIIEAFVRHTAAFCDIHIFVDNGSTDGTLEIIRYLKEEGLRVEVYRTASVSYLEEDLNSFLYRAACSMGMDWVLFLDADEFLDDRRSPIGFRAECERLSSPDADIACMHLCLVDYEATSHDDPAEVNVVKRITRRRDKSDNMKVCVRAIADYNKVVIAAGSHNVACTDDRRIRYHISNNITLAHFSERSVYIWIRKFVKGWAKILASPPEVEERGHSSHYKAPFELLKNHPASFFSDEKLMSFKNESPHLKLDPIVYRGQEIRYFRNTDSKMHTISSLMSYVAELAQSHSKVMSIARKNGISLEGEDRITKIF